MGESVGHALRIIPAYAGSTPLPDRTNRSLADHPRIRGEHVWFWRFSGGIWWIIPAYAGSTRPGGLCTSPSRDHPRIRGEHPVGMDVTITSPGSSPHTRGAHGGLLVLAGGAGIIPAYAGSTNFDRLLYYDTEDHPRIRGEHFFVTFRDARLLGSSPHTRGALVCEARFVAVAGIIPGYAGSTDSKECPSSMIRDHPRIRGEHCDSAPSSARRAGSSPHTRGARSRRPRDAGCSRIIPAYAGSTIRAKAYDPNRRDHPRIRGEHPRST